jgi:hypothetical protein
MLPAANLFGSFEAPKNDLALALDRKRTPARDIS